MSPSTYLNLMYILVGIIIAVGVIILAVNLGGANSRRRKDPVRALSGTLPPEHEAKYEYSPSIIWYLIAFCAGFMVVLMLISPIAFPGSPIPAWVSIGMPALLVFCLVMIALSRGRKLTFDEKELTVNKCGVLFEGAKEVAWKQSFTIAWSEVENVEYSRNNLFVITTTAGRRLGVRPFFYNGGSMCGCNSVEIGMRMDYYARYFGHGEQDIKRMPEDHSYLIELLVPIAYSIVAAVLISCVYLLSVFVDYDKDDTDDTFDTEIYDPMEYLQSYVENTSAELPYYVFDSSLLFSDIQLGDDYLTEYYECNEDYYDMDFFQQTIYEDPGAIIDLADSGTIQFFSLLKENNRGYRAIYTGMTTGKTATLTFEPVEL